MTQELKVIIGIGLTSLVLLIGAVFFLSDTTQTTDKQDVDVTLLTNNAKHKIAAVNAKVTMVEFADYECPACKAVHPNIQKVLSEYNGKLTYIYRHFPLPQHTNAMHAARAAEAAGEQGKFWEMSDMLYNKQDEWSGKGNVTEIFTKYAKELGLNQEQFGNDFTSTKYDESINKDKSDATSLRVSSTPSIFINGELVQIPSYENLKKIIDEALKK